MAEVDENRWHSMPQKKASSSAFLFLAFGQLTAAQSAKTGSSAAEQTSGLGFQDLKARNKQMGFLQSRHIMQRPKRPDNGHWLLGAIKYRVNKCAQMLAIMYWVGRECVGTVNSSWFFGGGLGFWCEIEIFELWLEFWWRVECDTLEAFWVNKRDGKFFWLLGLMRFEKHLTCWRL